MSQLAIVETFADLPDTRCTAGQRRSPVGEGSDSPQSPPLASNHQNPPTDPVAMTTDCCGYVAS